MEMTSNPRLRDTLYLATGEKPLVSFQLMSDLHLEFFESLADRKQYQFKAAAPYLALLVSLLPSLYSLLFSSNRPS